MTTTSALNTTSGRAARKQLGRLCSHIGLEYQEAMLRPDPAEFDPRRPVHRAYEKMTPALTPLWRTELEPWQVSAIEAAAGNRMEQFGYERQTRGATGMSRASLEALVEMTFQKFFRSRPPVVAQRPLVPSGGD